MSEFLFLARIEIATSSPTHTHGPRGGGGGANRALWLFPNLEEVFKFGAVTSLGRVIA